MDQNTQSKVLYAFLSETLNAKGFSLDEETFNQIEANISLSEKEGPESEQMRSVLVKEATDGKYSAKMFSLYNITQLSLHDLVEMAIKGATVFTMANETKVKITLAILAVANDFYKHLSADLNEAEAKVLLAIFYIEAETFSAADVQEAYQKQFGEAIDATKLNTFLEAFKKMTILHYNFTTQLYATNQSISFTR
jgi:hypothetical protein